MRLSSTEQFAQAVAGNAILGQALLDIARLQLGADAPFEQVDKQATKLLGRALFAVGIDPKTELAQRQRLTQVLRGDPISDTALCNRPSNTFLPGHEWAWNLELALTAVSADSLTRRQLARRERILKRLRENL